VGRGLRFQLLGDRSDGDRASVSLRHYLTRRRRSPNLRLTTSHQGFCTSERMIFKKRRLQLANIRAYRFETVLFPAFATQTLAPQNAAPSRKSPTGKIPINAPLLASTFVTVLLLKPSGYGTPGEIRGHRHSRSKNYLHTCDAGTLLRSSDKGDFGLGERRRRCASTTGLFEILSMMNPRKVSFCADAQNCSRSVY
jgi:hypothetical protein